MSDVQPIFMRGATPMRGRLFLHRALSSVAPSMSSSLTELLQELEGSPGCLAKGDASTAAGVACFPNANPQRPIL